MLSNISTAPKSLKEDLVSSTPKTVSANLETASLASLTQANNALKTKNAQTAKVTNTILSRAEEIGIPEKITLAYILRNWKKIGEFIEQIIHMLKALRNNA